MTDTSVPAPNPYPAAAAAPAGGGAGRAALILAIVLVVLGLVIQVIAQLVPRIAYDFDLGSAAIGGFFTVTNLVTGVIALIVVILGAVGVQPRQPRGRLAAAAGLGIGAAHLVSVAVALVAPLALYAVL
jgi:hypothetical protein